MREFVPREDNSPRVAHIAGLCLSYDHCLLNGADAAKVAAALRLILLDPAVKTIFVNIFGGILRCDVFARGFQPWREEEAELLLTDTPTRAALVVPGRIQDAMTLTKEIGWAEGHERARRKSSPPPETEREPETDG